MANRVAKKKMKSVMTLIKSDKILLVLISVLVNNKIAIVIISHDLKLSREVK